MGGGYIGRVGCARVCVCVGRYVRSHACMYVCIHGGR